MTETEKVLIDATKQVYINKNIVDTIAKQLSEKVKNQIHRNAKKGRLYSKPLDATSDHYKLLFVEAYYTIDLSSCECLPDVQVVLAYVSTLTGTKDEERMVNEMIDLCKGNKPLPSNHKHFDVLQIEYLSIPISQIVRGTHCNND